MDIRKGEYSHLFFQHYKNASGGSSGYLPAAAILFLWEIFANCYCIFIIINDNYIKRTPKMEAKPCREKFHKSLNFYINKERAMQQKEKDMKIEVKVEEGIAAGIFCNFSNISHSPEEFVYDFIFVHPAPPPGFGKLMSRMIITPSHAKRFLMALSDNIREYEERFGEIDIHAQLDDGGRLQ